MASKKIYVVIGHGKCGKSSLIRALTGVYRSASTKIGLKDTKIINWTRVIPQSAQEADLSPQGLLNKLDKDGGSTHALIALRFHPYKGHGPAIDYLNALVKVHSIEKIVFMGEEAVVDTFTFGSIQQNVIDSSYSRPVNGNASLVRDWWSWL